MQLQLSSKSDIYLPLINHALLSSSAHATFTPPYLLSKSWPLLKANRLYQIVFLISQAIEIQHILHYKQTREKRFELQQLYISSNQIVRGAHFMQLQTKYISEATQSLRASRILVQQLELTLQIRYFLHISLQQQKCANLSALNFLEYLVEEIMVILLNSAEG